MEKDYCVVRSYSRYNGEMKGWAFIFPHGMRTAEAWRLLREDIIYPRGKPNTYSYSPTGLWFPGPVRFHRRKNRQVVITQEYTLDC